MKNDELKKPILLVTMILGILLVLSFLPTEQTIFGLTLKPVDIISDIRPEPAENDTTAMTENKNLNKASFSLGETALTLLNDLVAKKSSNVVPGEVPQFKEIALTGNLEQMKHFFDAIKKSDKQVVRIAHYGDSAIEGDNISADMRDKLQRQFNGAGVGMLAITSQDTRFRPTITHSFSDSWQSASIFTVNPKRLPVGINGEIFIPERMSWVQYVTTARYRKLKELKTVKLFYSNAKKSAVNYTFDGKESGSVTLEDGPGIKMASFETKGKAAQVKIEMPQKDQAYFYCVSLENGPGIYVDNFPLRGNSGVNLNDIEQPVLNDFAKYLDYKLIILYFGLNIAGTDNSDYTWYEREMVKAIGKFKRAFPECSILVVSVSDKSVKKGSKFVTNPSIPALVKAQQDIARKANVAYWNLFEAMGGMDAMDKWVNATPPMATKDYTHFTINGSKKVAEMLTDAIIKSYNEYKK